VCPTVSDLIIKTLKTSAVPCDEDRGRAGGRAHRPAQTGMAGLVGASEGAPGPGSLRSGLYPDALYPEKETM
jgi:hypothetical protein